MASAMTFSGSARVVLISAMASGQGKTTVTAALARKLVRQGKRVRVFKTGPDFLDPMMLARAFGVPVLAVLDASAMAQTAGAVMAGLRDYGPVNLAGVIANRIASPRHAEMVAGAMRDIPVLASLGRQQQSLPERHLGLVQPEEVAQIDTMLDALAEQLTIDDTAWNGLPEIRFEASVVPDAVGRPLAGKTIAVARDAAFAFIYPANLDCLRELGASLVFFSPLADEAVPDEADAVYLPGGYPELHASVLGQALCWQASIRAAHQAGKAIVAECGGMMALAETLLDQQGTVWPMSGLLQGQVAMQKRLAALGPQAWDTAQGELRGHAFHYSRFETSCTPFAHTTKHGSGEPGEAIYRDGKLTASYFHAYFPSCPGAVAQLFLGQDGA